MTFKSLSAVFVTVSNIIGYACLSATVHAIIWLMLAEIVHFEEVPLGYLTPYKRLLLVGEI